jgi:hypothetical protein
MDTYYKRYSDNTKYQVVLKQDDVPYYQGVWEDDPYI